MFVCLFEYQHKCTTGQAAPHDLQCLDVDHCLVLRIQRVKMRRSTIIPKHLDQDPIEGTNCWDALDLTRLDGHMVYAAC
jgi:hypothetical protein